MRLYLIRHGQTVANAEGRIQGQSEFPLSELGVQQAVATARALAHLPLDGLYSSPLTRAAQTAEVLARELGLAIRFDDRLKELQAGVFQGLLWTECEARYPEATARWRSEDPDFALPQGESRRRLAERGQQALEAIRSDPCGHAVVVAHGGLLTAVLKALLCIPTGRHPFGLANCSITELTWKSDVRLVRLNDTGHLQLLEADGDEGSFGEL